MNDCLSRSHYTYYCFALLIVCNAVFAVVSGTNGRKNDRNTGGRWYDKTKWSNAAQNPPPIVEGSGNSDVVSDLDEARGLGPDDEDSETGSGAMESPGSIEEGSGQGGVKFESTTDSTFDVTYSTKSNATIRLTKEPAPSTKISPSDSVTEAALFLTTTLAQRPVTQQEPVHSTHEVPGYPVVDGVAEDDEEDEEDDDEDDEEDDDEDLYSFGAGGSSSLAPIVPPIAVDVDPQQPSIIITQPPPTATISVKPPPIPIDPTLTVAITPASGVASKPPTAVQPSPTDEDMYDRTPDKHKDRHGFQWIFSAGVLTAVIGGAVVGLLAAILLVMFVVYRMRKKDEGSYVLDEPKAPPTYPYAYHKAPAREFYA